MEGAMRWAWIIGGLYVATGAFLLFACLHPLRDALDAHSLDLMIIGSTYQALQGLALMVIAQGGTARVGAGLIAAGTAASCARLYALVFAGVHPLMVIIPIGGAVTLLGWVVVILAKPGGRG